MATTTAKKKGIHFAWFVLIGVLLMMGLCRGGINSGMGLFFQPSAPTCTSAWAKWQ